MQNSTNTMENRAAKEKKNHYYVSELKSEFLTNEFKINVVTPDVIIMDLLFLRRGGSTEEGIIWGEV